MKKGQVEILALIVGFFVIVGGILIAMSYSNLGLVVVTIGLLIEAIKWLIKKGL